MCNLVLIDNGTKKENNNLDDLVDINEDDVVLGPAYSTFKILPMQGVPKALVVMLLNAAKPKERRAFKTSTPANEWGFEYPEEKDFWEDSDGSWKAIEKRPMYNIKIDTKKLLASVAADTKRTAQERLAELQKGVVCNIKEMPENQTVVSVRQDEKVIK